MCGARTPIFLHMHDQAAAAQVLAAVEMEAMDLASHLLLGGHALMGGFCTWYCEALVDPPLLHCVSNGSNSGRTWQA